MLSRHAQVQTLSPASRHLEDLFTGQKQAFLESPNPTLGQRREHLTCLMEILIRDQEELAAAISADFGNRSHAETLSAEIMVSVEGLRYARSRLRRWMRPRRAHIGRLMLSTSAKTEYQPKGVVGIIAPWNYPLLMVTSPLTYALAAGNRVMIKPSEFTPRTSAHMQKMFGEIYHEDHVSVVTGEADVGIEFSRLPFDHLLFTGSTGVGRHIMRAAAENLTPVTLELGGKSPTIVTRDVDLKMAAERICFGKALNAGQTCTAPDYVLCPHDMQDELVDHLRGSFTKMFPTVGDNDDYTSIASDRQYERLQDLVHDARTKEAKILEINPAGEKMPHQSRKIPLTVLLNVHDDMRIMQEEIFGPLLPIVPYDSIDDVIEYINARPRPLALNFFDSNRKRIRKVLDHTHSGGVCINDAIMHVAVDDLPFGGTGDSGMGRYHGHEGFATFSNIRGVYRRPRWLNTARTLYPPHGSRLQKFLHRFTLKR
ncbi:MAG: coniferyl aldehyde dehydrogenase [Gammaproteobacteria bacterium]|nr:coniferyl aldehyde dehydrogenase [Gammaproteobacteria bacterium]MDH3767445.1 coniferyl aldehyde dehydrogenase [Gammaproteobacteria bacterium]